MRAFAPVTTTVFVITMLSMSHVSASDRTATGLAIRLSAR